MQRIVLMVIAVLAAASAEAEDSLTLGGSGTDIGTMQIMAAAFMDSQPGVEATVLPSLGSGGGVRAVLHGAVDIALTSRPLKDGERTAGAREFGYARTPFVFATSQDNPATGLTSADLIAIYLGEHTTWPDGTSIRLVLRPETDSDHDVVRSEIPEIAVAFTQALRNPLIPVTYTDQETADQLERLRWGLGTTSLSVIMGEGRTLKALALNGTAPTLEALADGSYPMSKSLYLVTGPEPGDLARAFIGFVHSAQGTAILRRTGHLVVEATGG